MVERPPGLLLAVDIGNTNVTVGVFRGERLVREWRLRTDAGRSTGSYGRELAGLVSRDLKGKRVDRVVFGSVVPRLSPVLRDLARRRFGVRAVEITPKTALGMRLRVDRPAEVGADRLLNSLAAFRMFGGPSVVVDFGTATTFDCISKRGDYIGGAILPGPHLAARALALNAAKLPEVPIRPTRRVIGKNTVECIQAGLYYGYLGMVERVLKETLIELRGNRSRVPVILTGGLARLFSAGMSRKVLVVPDLTLQGLRLAGGIVCGKCG
ncbi:type III pantothenate kinase [Elusimicrobiota bacterium]